VKILTWCKYPNLHLAAGAPDCIGLLFNTHWSFFLVFRRVRKIAKSDCYLRHVLSVCPSVRPHGTTRLRLDGFSWNFIFEDFSKICLENSSFIKIGQELRVLYMKTKIHFWYLAHFFLELEMCQTKVVEKIKTHILFSKIVPFMRKCGKILKSGAGHRWQYGAWLQIHTLTLYNTQCFSTTTMAARTRLNVTLYVHCLSCYAYLKSLHSPEKPFSHPDLHYVIDKSPVNILGTHFS
jgi:hypothetical protein